MSNSELDIIYEDKNIIVLNKPAELLTHPTRSAVARARRARSAGAKARQVNKQEKDTLASRIINHYPEIKNVGDSPLRPGVVHRLDKDTSGLIIVAKNNNAYSHLKNQFKRRLIKKQYTALVMGRIKGKRGTITKPITRSKRNPSKRTVGLWGRWKSAITHYEIIRRFKDYTLLNISPKTGRTHQIRVHMASIGHPVAGDKVYKFKRQPTPKRLNRQFLHASFLKFQSPDGKTVEFQSELPSDLQKVLHKLD